MEEPVRVSGWAVAAFHWTGGGPALRPEVGVGGAPQTLPVSKLQFAKVLATMEAEMKDSPSSRVGGVTVVVLGGTWTSAVRSRPAASASEVFGPP